MVEKESGEYFYKLHGAGLLNRYMQDSIIQNLL